MRRRGVGVAARVLLATTAVVSVLLGLAVPAEAGTVGNLTGPTLSTTAAGATGVEYTGIGFNVSATGALATTAGNNIVVTGPAGTVFANSCSAKAHDDTTGFDVSACGGSTSNGGATVTLPINQNHPVNAGDHITLTLLRVTNPSTPSTSFSLTVSTSADQTAASSSPYTVTATQPISAPTAPVLSTTAAGATAVEYNNVGFTVSGTGQLSPNGATITVTGPAGTVFANSCSAKAHDDTTGFDVSACGGTTSGASVTLPINQNHPVNAGDHITLTLLRVTNPGTPSTSYSLSVSTSSDQGATSGTYTVTAAQGISAPTAPVLSTTAAGATAVEYNNVGFTVSGTGQLSPNGATITVTGPAGTVFANSCAAKAHDDTTGFDVSACGGTTNGASVTLPINQNHPVNAGDHITLTLLRVTNPGTPSTSYSLSVSTSSDQGATSGTYTVTPAQAISAPTAPALSTTAATATAVEYNTVGFTVSSTGQLSPNGATITVTGPAGTVFANSCSAKAHDDTTGFDVSACGGNTSGASVTLPINQNHPVNAGDHITLTLLRVANPSTPSTSYSLTVVTSSDQGATSGTYTVTPAQTVSGVQTAVSTPAAGATGVEYRVSFSTSSTGRLTNNGGAITVTGPAGTVFSNSCSARAHDDTTGLDVSACGGSTSGASVTLPLNQNRTANPGDHITLTLQNVTNPAAGASPLSVSTTSDPSPVASAPYTSPIPPVPSVTGLSPASGTGAGGTSVTITGSGFTGATAVSFGANPAAGFTVNSDTQITATSPAGTGTVDVTVATPGGTSPLGTADRFTYSNGGPAPTVTAVSPASGPTAGGTSVTISGTGFTGATAVTFGTVAATTYTVTSDTQITATSPAGSGTVDVTVTTPNGTSATGTTDRFAYLLPPPTVTGLSPTSGPAGGGTTVTVTGTGFTGATAVKFGSTAASTFTVNTDTQLTATSPTGSGTVDVTVTTPNGTSAAAVADQFTYTAPPTTTTTSTSTTSTTVAPTTTTSTTVAPTTTTSTTSTSTTTTTVAPTTTTTASPGTTTTVAPTTSTTVAASTTTTSTPDTVPPSTSSTSTSVAPPTSTTAPPVTTTVPPPTSTSTPTTVATTTTSPTTTTVPPTTTTPPTTQPPTTTATTAATVPAPPPAVAPGSPTATTAAPARVTPPTSAVTTSTSTTAPAPPTTRPGDALATANTAPAAPSSPQLATPGLVAVSKTGATSGPPGVGLRVAGDGYPSDCSTVYIFFDGTRIGTTTPDAAGRVSDGGLEVPGEAKPGPHRVTSSCRASGSPVVHAATFQVMASDAHQVAMITALPKPDQLDFSAKAMLTSAAIATGMVFLIAFPGELFNTTLEEHYDEVRHWFGLGPKRLASESGRSQVVPFVAFLLVGGLLYSLLNPNFRVDRSTLGAALGVSIAMGVVTLAFDLPSLFYIRREHGDWGRLVILPGTLLLAAACVVLSRVVHFLPGYFYGLIAGMAFRHRVSDELKGRLAAVSTVLVLALSIGSWLAMGPVRAAADKPGASLAVLVLEATLGGIFWCGLDSLVIGMLPLRFLQGSQLRAWSRRGWMALFLLTQVAFVHILLRPNTGYVADTKHSPTTIVVALFVAFAVLSVAFWAYFRFRSGGAEEVDEAGPAFVEVG